MVWEGGFAPLSRFDAGQKKAIVSRFDVFLSQNNVDKPWVIKLKDDLTRYGVKVWPDGADSARPVTSFISSPSASGMS